VAGLLLTLAVLGSIASFFLVYVMYMVAGLGYSALAAGLTAFTWPLGIAIASGASIKPAPKVGRPVLSTGLALMALTMGALAAIVQAMGDGPASWHLAPLLLAGGLGMGLVMPILMDFVLAGVPSRDAGAASGVLNMVMQVGAAAGVAAIGVIFFGTIEAQIATESAAAAFQAATVTALVCEAGLLLGRSSSASCFRAGRGSGNRETCSNGASDVRGTGGDRLNGVQGRHDYRLPAGRRGPRARGAARGDVLRLQPRAARSAAR
jgi:MFS family permease